ncbi:MAG: steroid delta-isomerase [Cytophagia bacterium]|nr:MAG: steroid delta-isomerase [Cytophagia bacterium]TAG41498.1 MAG: steroid delta-isomerase [Cytophagia bacterium]
MNFLSVFTLSVVLAMATTNLTNQNHSSVAVATCATPDMPAEMVAERIFDAYSNRNIDGFIAYFSNDVEVSLFPNKVLYKGKDNLRKAYKHFFETTPNFKCELLSRKIQNNHVVEEINVERVKGKVQKSIVVYEIENGMVQKMSFL